MVNFVSLTGGGFSAEREHRTDVAYDVRDHPQITFAVEGKRGVYPKPKANNVTDKLRVGEVTTGGGQKISKLCGSRLRMFPKQSANAAARRTIRREGKGKLVAYRALSAPWREKWQFAGSASPYFYYLP